VFIPVVCDYNITVNEVGKSKHNRNLLKYKESKHRQHVSALLSYKAIIRSDTHLLVVTYYVHMYSVKL